MTVPYTYLITHIPSNKKYYGVRYANGCHPNDLGVKYFSSSKDLLKLIEQDGTESFLFEVRKIFASGQKACEWESKVLKRLKVHTNDNWFNKVHNYTFSMYNREVVEKVRHSNLSKPNFFQDLGKKGGRARAESGDLLRLASKIYKVTFYDGSEEIVFNLKEFAENNNARYDTLRRCVSKEIPYKTKNISKIEIIGTR